MNKKNKHSIYFLIISIIFAFWPAIFFTLGQRDYLTFINQYNQEILIYTSILIGAVCFAISVGLYIKKPLLTPAVIMSGAVYAVLAYFTNVGSFFIR